MDRPDPRRIVGGSNLRVVKPNDLQYVREDGCHCGRCKHLAELEHGRAFLIQDGFWDRAFNTHKDGTDWQPQHFGDPRDYSVCELRGIAAHVFSTCPKWHEKRTWLRIFQKR